MEEPWFADHTEYTLKWIEPVWVGHQAKVVMVKISGLNIR